MHNRYFSNGDKPLVTLIKRKGRVLQDNEAVLFDDSVPHAWIMEDCNLEIFYYRQKGITKDPVTMGDYCIDDYFKGV